jgi:hypothetical protein
VREPNAVFGDMTATVCVLRNSGGSEVDFPSCSCKTVFRTFAGLIRVLPIDAKMDLHLFQEMEEAVGNHP